MKNRKGRLSLSGTLLFVRVVCVFVPWMPIERERERRKRPISLNNRQLFSFPFFSICFLFHFHFHSFFTKYHHTCITIPPRDQHFFIYYCFSLLFLNPGRSGGHGQISTPSTNRGSSIMLLFYDGVFHFVPMT